MTRPSAINTTGDIADASAAFSPTSDSSPSRSRQGLFARSPTGNKQQVKGIGIRTPGKKPALTDGGFSDGNHEIAIADQRGHAAIHVNAKERSSSIWQRVLRSPVFQFAVAQVFVIWAVAAAVLYVQDAVFQHQQDAGASGGGASRSGWFLGGENEAEGHERYSHSQQDSLLSRIKKHVRDRCPLQSPVCRSTVEANSWKHHGEGRRERNGEKLPLVIFFAGVEGSGHKFFEQVFRDIPGVNFTVTQYEPTLHLTVDDNQTNVHGQQADTGCPRLPYARSLRDYAHDIAQRLADLPEGVPYLRARDSYPLGRVRTPLARPDLLSLLHMDGLLFDLKVVVLSRGLPDAIRSAFRMGYHGKDLGLQVRMVEDEMTFLDASIRLIPCSKYIILDFDWVADSPQMIARPLADFLGMGVTPEDIVTAVSGAKHTKPKHHTTYPEFGNQPLHEFFAMRTDLWPLLAAARNTPYFWPHHRRDWPVEDSITAAQVAERRKGYDYD